MDSRHVAPLLIGTLLLMLGGLGLFGVGPAAAIVAGSCPTGYYYVSSSGLYVYYNGNYYMDCVTASWIQSNGTHLMASQWVSIQAQAWGMTASQFTEEDANTYVWCQAGSPVDTSAGWTCSQPGAIATIADATYIYQAGGSYFDLAPSQLVSPVSGSMECPAGYQPEGSPCPPSTSTTTISRSSTVSQSTTTASSTQESLGPGGQGGSTSPSPPGTQPDYLAYALMAAGVALLVIGSVKMAKDED